MPDMTAYRVLSKRQLVLLLGAVLCLGLLGIWIAMQWVEGLSDRQSELVATDPARAAIELAAQLRLIAAINGTLLLVCGGFLIRYGIKGIGTESMPPVGSWVIQGQPVHTGRKAVVISRLTVAAGMLLLLLAGASSLILWRTAGQVQTMAAAT